MSKTLKTSLFITGMFFIINVLTALPFHNHEMLYFQKINNDYNMIRLNLDKCIYLLENDEETSAVSQIQKIDSDANNFGGIFVIDPSNGKILASPEIKSTNDKTALETEDINGKALAREAIKIWQQRRTQSWWSDFSDMLTVKHLEFFTDIAVTDEGKVYVVAIGKNDINLQRMFVEKLVKQACKILKETGAEEAYKIFDKEDSKFKYNSKSYIYVYSDNGICLYNPNYPELQGKDATTADDGTKEMVEMAKIQGSGWLECQARIPGENKEGKKEIYFQSVFSNGKTYIVGSGLYVDSE